MLVICLDDPVRDIRRPPKDAYAVLGKILAYNETTFDKFAHTISAEPSSNLYTWGTTDRRDSARKRNIERDRADNEAE